MRPDADLDALEGIPRDTVTGGPKPAEIILPAMDVAAETQVVRFEAHLTERHIVVDAFDGRLLNIMSCDSEGFVYVGLRIILQKE